MEGLLLHSQSDYSWSLFSFAAVYFNNVHTNPDIVFCRQNVSARSTHSGILCLWIMFQNGMHYCQWRQNTSKNEDLLKENTTILLRIDRTWQFYVSCLIEVQALLPIESQNQLYSSFTAQGQCRLYDSCGQQEKFSLRHTFYNIPSVINKWFSWT